MRVRTTRSLLASGHGPQWVSKRRASMPAVCLASTRGTNGWRPPGDRTACSKARVRCACSVAAAVDSVRPSAPLRRRVGTAIPSTHSRAGWCKLPFGISRPAASLPGRASTGNDGKGSSRTSWRSGRPVDWACRAASGVLIHPSYGPWISLRAVILSSEELEPTPPLEGWAALRWMRGALCEGVPRCCGRRSRLRRDGLHLDDAEPARVSDALRSASRLRGRARARRNPGPGAALSRGRDRFHERARLTEGDCPNAITRCTPAARFPHSGSPSPIGFRPRLSPVRTPIASTSRSCRNAKGRPRADTSEEPGS